MRTAEIMLAVRIYQMREVVLQAVVNRSNVTEAFVQHLLVGIVDAIRPNTDGGHVAKGASKQVRIKRFGLKTCRNGVGFVQMNENLEVLTQSLDSLRREGEVEVGGHLTDLRKSLVYKKVRASATFVPENVLQ